MITSVTLDLERELIADGADVVVGCDEVGRGAIAGPVTVGLAVLAMPFGPVPDGLADSKQLRPSAREALVAPIRGWVAGLGIGSATAAEIERDGIIRSLATAAARGAEQLRGLGNGRRVVVILDGSFDWISAVVPGWRVVTQVKGDQKCASVAAASVIAKVERDSVMSELAIGAPSYGWAQNKGYGTKTHRQAIVEHGPHELHRRSWLH